VTTDASALSAEPSRRLRRKANTRRRLLDAARTLFVERGYDATRPQDISRSADLAAGTFYVHFAGKRDVFLAFTEQVTEELLARTRLRVAGARSFQQLLRGALEALFEYSAAHPGVLWAASADAAVSAAGVPTGASLRDRLAEVLAHSMAEGMARGEVPDDYDPLLVAHGVVGFLHQALLHAARAGLDREAVLANVKEFCDRALVKRAEPEEITP
jgi:AcrR family transcriptional regulator